MVFNENHTEYKRRQRVIKKSNKPKKIKITPLPESDNESDIKIEDEHEQIDPTRIAYKAFKDVDGVLTCRDFKFKVGETYSIEKGTTLEMCRNGFHCCRNMRNTIEYYSDEITSYRYCEVLIGEESITIKGKTVTSTIKILRELGREEIERKLTGEVIFDWEVSPRYYIAGTRVCRNEMIAHMFDKLRFNEKHGWYSAECAKLWRCQTYRLRNGNVVKVTWNSRKPGRIPGDWPDSMYIGVIRGNSIETIEGGEMLRRLRISC